MLSHCVPSPLGNAARARAWQLLRLAAQTHRVLLACCYDDAVRLDQWYALNSHAQSVVIEPPGLMASLRGAVSGGVCRSTLGGLRNTIDPWRHEHAIDAVLCTHPALWPCAAGVNAPLAVCDIDAPAPSGFHADPATATAFHRWWRRRLLRDRDLTNRRAARECPVLTVSHAEDLAAFEGEPCRTLLLPVAVDLDFFSPHHDEETRHRDHPRLVFHADWSRRDGARAFSWFARRVWPAVHDAVPAARLCDSHAPTNAGAADALRDASVIVSPDPDPGVSRWPILQALAMHRPVVASRSAVADLDLQHGEHLLLTHRPNDWVDHCVASLRSASIRLHLARGARAFVERHGPIALTGQNLFNSLLPHPTRLPLAHAA